MESNWNIYIIFTRKVEIVWRHFILTFQWYSCNYKTLNLMLFSVIRNIYLFTCIIEQILKNFPIMSEAEQISCLRRLLGLSVTDDLKWKLYVRSIAKTDGKMLCCLWSSRSNTGSLQSNFARARSGIKQSNAAISHLELTVFTFQH